MNLISLLIVSFFTPSIASAATLTEQDPATVVQECKGKNPKKFVYVFQQWHLPPNEKTEITTGKFPEQEENQTATFLILDKWIQEKAIATVIAEGCEGEITPSFKTEFNGWDYARFKNELSNPLFNRITAHVPLKLEVKHEDKVKTLCGDSDQLVKAGNLAFSDIRGYGGFITRIEQIKDPVKKSEYLKLAKELLKVPVSTKEEVVVTKLKAAIKNNVNEIKKTLAQRNQFFVKKILSTSDRESALVIGGAHVYDLVTKLEVANIGCQIIKPKGYNFDPEAMFIAIENMF